VANAGTLLAYNQEYSELGSTSLFAMRRLFIISASLAALSLADLTQATELVRQFSGDRSKQTAEFEVEAPWLIDWRVNSDFPSSMGLSVVLLNANGAYEGRVVKTKAPGEGVRLMQEGGRYSFKVDATVANWTIKVEQLTQAEAELYTPKPRGLLD
jgi:hypothetical protein